MIFYISEILFRTFKFTTPLAVSQYLVRVLAPHLNGQDILSRSEINHWCTFSNLKLSGGELEAHLDCLNEALSTRTFLVGNSVSLADIYVFSVLYSEWLSFCHNSLPYLMN